MQQDACDPQATSSTDFLPILSPHLGGHSALKRQGSASFFACLLSLCRRGCVAAEVLLACFFCLVIFLALADPGCKCRGAPGEKNEGWYSWSFLQPQVRNHFWTLGLACPVLSMSTRTSISEDQTLSTTDESEQPISSSDPHDSQLHDLSS